MDGAIDAQICVHCCVHGGIYMPTPTCNMSAAANISLRLQLQLQLQFSMLRCLTVNLTDGSFKCQSILLTHTNHSPMRHAPPPAFTWHLPLGPPSWTACSCRLAQLAHTIAS